MNYKEQLIQVAQQIGNVDLALVACGEKDAYVFLTEYLESEKVGQANVPATSKQKLESIIKANKSRRAKVQKFLAAELKDAAKGEGLNNKYIEIYKAELALLDKYAMIALIDIINSTEQLKIDIADMTLDEDIEALEA